MDLPPLHIGTQGIKLYIKSYIKLYQVLASIFTWIRQNCGWSKLIDRWSGSLLYFDVKSIGIFVLKSKGSLLLQLLRPPFFFSGPLSLAGLTRYRYGILTPEPLVLRLCLVPNVVVRAIDDDSRPTSENNILKNVPVTRRVLTTRLLNYNLPVNTWSHQGIIS
jgi:hypothetical protein